MAWSRILGHDAVVERLRESLARGRLSHAYLFVGREGIGKELVARELAKALLCRTGAGEACDACPACRKVDHGSHPDVTFVRRIAESAKGQSRSQILIDQVREEIQEAIAYKPFEGSHKVFAVADAERMSEEAQNCLLKTLEEPPPHSLLILIAARLEPFVDTVVSRCQVVRFRPLAPGLVERILGERDDLEAGTARVLARLSGGSPGRALRYLDEGAYETARWLLGELATLAPAKEFVVASELFETVREQGSPLEVARERLRPVLDLLTLAWRDLFLRASGCSEELLTWSGETEELTALGEGLPAARAQRLAELSLAAREQLDANANIKLLLENLLLGLGGLLHAREAVIER